MQVYFPEGFPIDLDTGKPVSSMQLIGKKVVKTSFRVVNSLEVLILTLN